MNPETILRVLSDTATQVYAQQEIIAQLEDANKALRAELAEFRPALDEAQDTTTMRGPDG